MQVHATGNAAIADFERGDLASARSLAEAELAKSDRSPLLHHLIGLIDCRMGRFDTGIEWLKRAIDCDPTNLAYRIILVRALIDDGRAAEALDAAIPPAGTSAAEIELWQARAEAAFYAGHRATESEAWRAVCDARSQDPMAWTNLGRSLLSQYRFTEAEVAYRKALAIAPVLMVRHELGLGLERSNQLEKLGLLLDTALADGVPKERLADLWALRALRAGDVDEAARLAEAIDIRPDPFRLNGLRAKIADAAGRPVEAFAAATAMNWSVDNPSLWRARGRTYRDELRARDQAMAAWPPELPRLPKSARSSPAFLVGFPRSGTTLAETFLLGHPDVRVLEEMPLLEMAAESLGGIAQLGRATAEQLADARDGYFAGLDAHIETGFAGLVVDKLALNMLSLPLIASLFPDAHIIFAQRHPCDCVLSGFMQAFIPNNAMASFLDLADSADLYDAALRVFTRADDQLKLPTHRLVYEDLVTDPVAVLRPLTDFLGLEWRPELIDHRATAARRSAIKTPSYASVSQPLSNQPCGRWRRYKAQLEPVLPILMPWAERLGYGRD
jgi:tetratricopeptide (TPR) repeat protein